MCVCVRAGVRAGVRVCLCACSFEPTFISKNINTSNDESILSKSVNVMINGNPTTTEI